MTPIKITVKFKKNGTLYCKVVELVLSLPQNLMKCVVERVEIRPFYEAEIVRWFSL